MTLLRLLTLLIGSLTLLWFSQSCPFGFISFFCHYYLLYNGFPSIGKFWSCGCLSSHWLSIKLKTGCPVSWHRLIVLIAMVFIIIWVIFHERIFWNSVPLLLLVNFVSGFRLELMYISLIINISSSLTYLLVFSCLCCCLSL